jgi:ABC-type arginine transport system permease subunit
MSARARFYLWATAVPALVVSLFCFFGGQLLRAPSYSVIRTVGFNTFAYWGVLYGVVAVSAAWAAIRGHETLARVALIAPRSGWRAGPQGSASRTTRIISQDRQAFWYGGLWP